MSIGSEIHSRSRRPFPLAQTTFFSKSRFYSSSPTISGRRSALSRDPFASSRFRIWSYIELTASAPGPRVSFNVDAFTPFTRTSQPIISRPYPFDNIDRMEATRRLTVLRATSRAWLLVVRSGEHGSRTRNRLTGTTFQSLTRLFH